MARKSDARPWSSTPFGGLPTELSWKIFIDRYTMKDANRAFQAGDLAVVPTRDDPKWPQKELGEVLAVEGDRLRVRLLTGEAKGEELERSRLSCDRPLETTLEEVAARIGRGIARVEPDEERRERWARQFAEEIAALRMIPGGRVWAGAGTGLDLTLYNCYVIPSPRDSRQGIVETLGQMIEIMSRGGGVGINVSSLRPFRAPVRSVNGRSSGAVSWMELYSMATGLIEQGGCFGPDERIATDRGLIRAEDLYRRMGTGEEFHALTHEGPRRITARFANGVKKLYRVTTRRGFTVEVTAEHRMGVLRGGEITTVPLQELSVGDEILTLLGHGLEGRPVRLARVRYERSRMSTTLHEDVRLPETLTPKLAYVLGYMYGDGYVHVGKKVRWQAPKAIKMSTPDSRPEIRERLVAWSRELFGVEPVVEPGDGSCHNVAIYSRLLVEFLAQNGLLKEHSEAVRVPEAVFQARPDVMGAFVAGYFDADGSDRGGKAGYGFDSASLGMLRDIQQLLAACGILSRISTTDRSSQGWRPIHRLAVTGAEFEGRFRDFIALSLKAGGRPGRRNHGHHHPRDVRHSLGVGGRYCQGVWESTQPRISYRALSRVRERLAAEGEAVAVLAADRLLRVLPDTIVSIEPSKTCEVYDFEVEETHMLSGNGIYTSNSRRGALMLQLDIRHPDWKRFVDIKKQPGRVENANISFRVTDDFMQAVKEDREWEFWFPDTSTPGYDEIWRGDFDDWEARGLPKVVYERRPAREVWREIIHAAWESAEPGVVFSTRHEKDSNSWYFNRLICTNPCVTGETLISTDRGLIRAVDLFRESGENVVVVDRRFGAKPRALASPVWMTGVKPVYKLRTKEGFELRLTADHRVMTERGWVEARHLQPGDRIYVLERTGGFGRAGSYDLGLVLGWLVGDGTLKEDRAVLSFFGEEKAELAPLFAQAVNRVVRPSTNGRNYEVGVVTATATEDRVSSTRLRELAAEHGLLEEKLRVPESVFRGSREMQLGFLRALFSADGHVEMGKKSRSAVVLSSKSTELLRGVQVLLLNFGIYSRIYRGRRPAGWQSLPDGHGGRARYWSQELSDLRITGASLVRFHEEVGFLQSQKRERLQAIVDSYSRGPYREEFVATFQELVPDGEEPVYDLNVSEVHAFAANGLVVHNCAEQPLPAWGVCTLGHVNLARMVNADGTDVDWERLGRSVRTLVRFLDDVVDATPYFMEENRQNQKRERRVGAGSMGLGELLIRLGLRYGSPEAVEFTERLYRFIALEAYRESVELAREKGPFPAFEAEKFLESGFMRRMPEEIREAVREHGIRNVTLLTQAPTGTVGTMVDTSTGIEPFYALRFTRRSRLGEDVQYVRVAREWMEAHPGEELPDYFVGAMDLTPEEHVQMQAAVQRWTDSSISKTANAPAGYTEEQVADLYMFAYDLGCKGVTVYRDRSRREQVLATTTEEAGQKATTAAPAAAEPRLRPEARPEVLTGRTTRIRTPLGNLYVTVNELNGRPFELFTQIGKAGSDVSALTEALARLISLALRSGVDPDAVAEQLIGIGGSQSVGFGPYRIRSVPDALGRILAGTWPDGHAGDQEAGSSSPEAPLRAPSPSAPEAGGRENGRRPRSPKDIDLCPVCGAIAVHQDGCVKCLECGFSSC